MPGREVDADVRHTAQATSHRLAPEAWRPTWKRRWRKFADVLQGLRFGSVTIIVQDGVVVQIDRLEKRRLQPNARRPEHRQVS